MSDLEKIELLQKIIHEELKRTERRILFLLDFFEIPKELWHKAFFMLDKTEDKDNPCTKSG